MIKHNVEALIIQRIPPCLLLPGKDFIHSLTLHVGRQNRAEVVQRGDHGIIDAGDDQQEHKKRQDIERSVHQQCAASQRRCRNAEFQHQAGGAVKNGVRHFGRNGLRFHGAYFVI